MHKTHTTPEDNEIEKLLSGSSESSDLVYTVIKQALVVAGGMLGSDRSRGYCLALICADFLAGAGLHLENEQKILLVGPRRILYLLAMAQQREFMISIHPSGRQRTSW